MTNEKDNSRVVRHISFTPAEDTVVQGLAENAGLSVNAYIRAQAVYGSVSSINWRALEEHTEAINAIGQEIKWYTTNQNPNRWLFGADLEMIIGCLKELIELEKAWIDGLRKSA